MKKIPLTPGLLSFAEQALIINEMIEILQRIDPFANSDLGKIAPADKLDGMPAYANGTDWNPNATGKGLYRWDSTTSLWVLIG